MQHVTASWLFLAACLTSLGSADGARAQATLIGLGDLPGGSFESSGRDVSDDGQVVVGSSSSSLQSLDPGEAFRWTAAAGMQGLGLLPGYGLTRADGVSADGSVVVGILHFTGVFRWTVGGGMQQIGFGDNFAGRVDVSADGSVVAGTGLGQQAFRWTEATGMQGLGGLPGGSGESSARAISADGKVVVGRAGNAAGRGEAFRWTEAGMQGLGDLPGGVFSSMALAVSSDGSVVVGWGESATGQRAVLWTASGAIADLGFQGTPMGVSADGSVVVGGGLGGQFEAFFWNGRHGVRSLRDVLAQAGADVDGWLLQGALGISPDGRKIVGFGRNPTGQNEAWLAILAPPPPSECGDGIDNDGDGHTDLEDPGCPIPEATPEDPACDDGQDNDGDGHTDTADPQCVTAWLSWEEPCGLGAELAGVLPLVAWLRRRRRGPRR